MLGRTQEVVQARGGYFPTLDSSASWGVKDYNVPELDKSYPRRYNLGLRQNVFRFGATLADVKRQEARVKSQAYLLQGTSENVALHTTRAYLNVLRNMQLAELAKENLINHERIGDQVKLRMQSGVDRRADLDQVMGRLALAQSNVVATKANLADAYTDYQAVVGRLPEGLVEVPKMDSTIPASMEQAEYYALQNYPIVKSAQADLEAREQQYKFAKRVLFPSLDVAADYNWDKNVDNPRKEEYLSAAGVVSFNIFNGLRNQARIKETMYQVNEAEQILENTKRQTVQSIRLSYEAYIAAQERVAHLEEYVKSTEATAAAFAEQWNIGRRTMFDLLDTQAEYINAKSDLVRAKFDKTYAEYRILSGMGALVHNLGLQWPEGARIDAKPEVAPVAVKKPEPAYEKTSDGFLKSDPDGFIRTR